MCFGFDVECYLVYLLMVFGVGQVMLLQMVGVYLVFVNGGYCVNLYLIVEVIDLNGVVVVCVQLFVVEQNVLCVIDVCNVYVMNSLLQSVVQCGMGVWINVLKCIDFVGKIGMMNDLYDVWFVGYQYMFVVIVWIGYDNLCSFGDCEIGGGLLLLVWIDYMGVVLKGVLEFKLMVLEGVELFGGELYFIEFMLGYGFVLMVGVLQVFVVQNVDEVVLYVDEQEKQDIMNLFCGY